MNYADTLDYLYSCLPMFHRIGAAAYKANLDNTIAISNLTDHPYTRFKSIHIAGTNGKGSVSHFLASILQENGLTVGLYTSPHFKDLSERIKINGKNISKNYICYFIEKYKHDFDQIKPSFFEMTVGMAFSYFADEKIDIAVVETGLGGRLDSTNIIHPVLSVITSISFDHTSLLGETLDKIAFEKAGIIKPNTPVVIGESKSETKPVFIVQAKKNNSPVYFADKNYNIRNSYLNKNPDQLLIVETERKKDGFIRKSESPLTGQYQNKNLLTILQSTDLLIQNGFTINEKQISSGIKNVIKNTGIMGRWQIICKTPLTICDMAHNEDGIRYVIEQLHSMTYDHLHIVFGMVNDKKTEPVLKLLPTHATYYFCKADSPRSLDPKELKNKASLFKLKGKTYQSVAEALSQAQKNADKNDLVFIGGSTFVVAEIL